MRDRVEALLKGAFDFRIHAGPEPDGERRTDYLEAGRDAYEAEMAGFVLMKHRHPTALAAYALNRMYPGFHTVGSIVLNTSVGGLNPEGVESSAKLGAKVVWMPTQDAGTVKLLDAPDAVRAVLEVAKSFAMAVASTHATFVDTEMLVRLAGSVGLERLVVTNPAARFGADEASHYCHTICTSSCLSCRTIPTRRQGNACARISTSSGQTAASSRRTSASGRTLPQQRGCGWPSRR